MKIMTFKQARDFCSEKGFILIRTSFGDYRLTLFDGDEASSYYTDDLEDAVATATNWNNLSVPEGDT